MNSLRNILLLGLTALSLSAFGADQKPAVTKKQDRPQPPTRPFDAGTADIVPFTDAGQLLEDGRAQRNCVGRYTLRVVGGKVFVYRVLDPERATLSLRMGADGGWGIEQLLRPGNQPVSPVTA